MTRSTARLAVTAALAAAVALLGACAASEPVPTATPAGASPSPPATAGVTAPASPATTPSATAGSSASPATAPPTLPPLSSPSPPATPSPVPSSGASVPPEVWQLLLDFPAGGALEVASVTAAAEGFVAVGSQPATDDDFFGLRQGVVWSSPNGRAWERATDPAFENATLLHVVALAETLYVFGIVSECPILADQCADVPDAGMTVWRGADGEWQKLPQSRSMRNALLDGVLAGPDGIIAYGSSGNRLRATLWLSSDGVRWEEVTELAGMDPISALAAGPDGFVAFGTRYVPQSDTIETVAAHSADGRSFQPASLPAQQDAVIESVAFGDAGFVAVGFDEDPAGLGLRAVALTSGDGRRWAVVEPAASFAGTGFHHVRAVPGGFLGLGFAPAGAQWEREAARSWVSSDGRHWRDYPALSGGPYRVLSGSAVGPSGIVVFALDYEDEPGPSATSTIHAWFAPLELVGP